MFIIYDLIFTLFILSYLPIFILKRKFHSGFITRLGFCLKDIKKQLLYSHPIWIHAVSVGEVLASKQLIAKLQEIYPDKRVVISTVTSTGNKIAKGLARKEDFVIYLPLDFSFIVRRVVNMINPEIFIIAETEIWPNLISYLSKRKVPIITVNARISDSSFFGYRAVRFLIKRVLNKISLFCVQTEVDSKRLLSLGVGKEKINITGNMKFDNAFFNDNEIKAYADKYKSLLCLKPNEKLLVAGSTHKGEEKIIIDVYEKLLRVFPDLRLLIAPRHPHRAKEIAKTVLSNAYDLQPIHISTLKAPCPSSKRLPVFILDVMGELRVFYELADIVFVGGSLIKKGGHNILEPAGFAKPIIFGPYMFNFRYMAKLFCEKEAAIQVDDSAGLQRALEFLLNNLDQAAILGKKAKDLLLNDRGATEKNLKAIEETVKNRIGAL